MDPAGGLRSVLHNTLVLSVGRHRISCWDADLWLYPNVAGTRDPDPGGRPVLVRLPLGIPLTPPGSPVAKEKPLLGLRAVRTNGLLLRIDGRLERVWIDTP